MAQADGRTPDEVRHDIQQEREQLASAVEDLREGLGEATNAAGALGAGFVLAGGIGATMRMLARRGREGKTRAKLGRFAIVDRD
jgi:hypothetical protein